MKMFVQDLICLGNRSLFPPDWNRPTALENRTQDHYFTTQRFIRNQAPAIKRREAANTQKQTLAFEELMTRARAVLILFCIGEP